MAQNKLLNMPPAYLSTLSLSSMGYTLLNSNVTTLTPGGVGFVGTQPYVILKHMRIMNALTTSAVTVTLYRGAVLSSAGATAFGWDNVSLPAQGYLDWVGQDRFDSADYLGGIASLPQAVVINMTGEIGLS
jgi:hypothetical protein